MAFLEIHQLLFQETVVLNLLEKFNQIYKSEKTPHYEESLKSFFLAEVQKRLPTSSHVLDLGCGSKSLFSDLDLEQMKVRAIDFSPVAIEHAEKKEGLYYEVADVTKMTEENSFDLVFDSHCLHCISKADDRKSAFQNIYRSLKSDGFFAGEMMVRSSKNNFNDPYKYTPDAFDLEKEILSHGFKIVYFVIARNLNFIQSSGESDLLRVIAKK